MVAWYVGLAAPKAARSVDVYWFLLLCLVHCRLSPHKKRKRQCNLKKNCQMDFDPSSPKIVLLNKVCALSENKKNVKKKKKFTRFDSHMISQSKIRLVEFVQCNKK